MEALSIIIPSKEIIGSLCCLLFTSRNKASIVIQSDHSPHSLHSIHAINLHASSFGNIVFSRFPFTSFTFDIRHRSSERYWVFARPATAHTTLLRSTHQRRASNSTCRRYEHGIPTPSMQQLWCSAGCHILFSGSCFNCWKSLLRTNRVFWNEWSYKVTFCVEPAIFSISSFHCTE